MSTQIDVREILPSIHVPTLVMHQSGDREAALEEGRYLAEHIPGALHKGECGVVDKKITGIAVHTGARVASEAGPREVLVSATVRDLVSGSGIRFDDRGERELKGVGARRTLCCRRSLK